MPLPDAEPSPSNSNVYEQLRTIKASDLTRAQLDKLRDPLYLDGASEDVLRRIKLIGEVTDQLSTSGPIPRTATIEQVTQSSDVGFFTIFKPGVGEVWQFIGGDLLASGGSAQINISLTDGTNYAYLGNTQVSGQEPLTFDNLYKLNDLWVTSDLYLGGDFTSIGTSARVTMAFIRIR